MGEIEESEEETLATVEEDLQETLSEVEATVKKALKHLLKKHMISDEKENEVEAAFVKELESNVKERIETEAHYVKEDAEEHLDKTLKSDISRKEKAENIESDLTTMRNYLTLEDEQKIEHGGKILQENIRGIAESIEKKILKEKLGINVSEEELVDSELESKVASVAENLLKQEKNEIDEMERNISVVTKKIDKKIQKVLDIIIIIIVIVIIIIIIIPC